MADKLELIDDDALKACLQTRGFVARVEVREAKVVAAGTRSESARIAAQVQEVLHGDAEGRIEVWRYTHGGDALLAKGKNYIVAVSGRGDGTAKPFVLNGYAVVRPGVEEASVKAHRAAIQRLTESQ